MNNYRFRYLSPDGQELVRTGEFDSVEELRLSLDNQGAFLIEATPYTPKSQQKGRVLFPSLHRFGLNAQIRFLEQLSLMISSGMTISSALHIMERNSSDSATSGVSAKLSKSLASGISLSQALEKDCKQFSGPVVGLLKMAEMTGEAAQCIDRAVDYLNRKKAMRSLIVSGLTYPVLMLLMTAGVVSFLVFKIIPKIQNFLQGRNVTLPYTTQKLIAITTWLQQNWMYLLMSVFCACLLWLIFRKIRSTRLLIDKLLLHVPVLRGIIINSQMANLCWLVAILIRSGQSLVDTLNICAASCANAEISRRLKKCAGEILNGSHSFSVSLYENSFPPLMQECVKVGEETGELSRVLTNMGEFYNRKIQQQVKWLSTVFEPIMIIVVGGLVGFVYFSFFQVIFRVATRH